MNVQMMWNLLATVRQFRQHDAWTRQRLEAYQAEQLSRLRQYASAHSPFYQQFHRGLEDRPLEALPVLTKAMLAAGKLSRKRAGSPCCSVGFGMALSKHPSRRRFSKRSWHKECCLRLFRYSRS